MNVRTWMVFRQPHYVLECPHASEGRAVGRSRLVERADAPAPVRVRGPTGGTVSRDDVVSAMGIARPWWRSISTSWSISACSTWNSGDPRGGGDRGRSTGQVLSTRRGRDRHERSRSALLHRRTALGCASRWPRTVRSARRRLFGPWPGIMGTPSLRVLNDLTVRSLRRWITFAPSWRGMASSRGPRDESSFSPTVPSMRWPRSTGNWFCGMNFFSSSGVPCKRRDYPVWWRVSIPSLGGAA